ncbi:MAG TPA: SRPBCC family protein [Actinomycetota bacterium]|nr:SRPBCC family protein [Actinomycetota bacterium]
MRPRARKGGGVAQVLRPDAGELEVRIQARPETVFEFFVDPEKMRRWKGTEAELDPRPGGTYRVGGIAGGATVVGEFVEIDPPRRLVFTWGWEGDEEVPPGSSTVEVTLTPDGDATVLHLVHRDLPVGQGPEAHGGMGALRAAARRGGVGTRPGAGSLVDVESVTVVPAVGGKEGEESWAHRSCTSRSTGRTRRSCSRSTRTCSAGRSTPTTR